MVVHTNGDSFARALRDHADCFRRAVDEAYRELLVDAADALVIVTPVKTGYAQGGWRVLKKGGQPSAPRPRVRPQ